MKKLLLLILASAILLAVGCENAAQTTTSQETTTAETTATETTPTTTEQTTTAGMTTTLPDGLYWDFTNPEAVESMQESLRQEAIESINAIPKEEKVQIILPKMSWMASPVCDELNENIDPKNIVVEMAQDTYHITDSAFIVNVTNNSDYDITLFGSKPMIESYQPYVFGGYHFGNDANAGWIRIPYIYHYGMQVPKRTTLAPGETVSLYFHNDELNYLYDEFDMKLTVGKTRLAVFMSGGPRYAEFEVIE